MHKISPTFPYVLFRKKDVLFYNFRIQLKKILNILIYLDYKIYIKTYNNQDRNVCSWKENRI